MKPTTNIHLDIRNHTLYLTIHREDKLNALNQATMKDLDRAFTYAAKEKSIRGVILTGQGTKAFVAGADIGEIGKLTLQKGKKFAQDGHKTFSKIEHCPKPVIAAVNGFALGGGCELSMACHLRVSVKTAKFSQPEVNLGIIPGYGGTQRLVHLVGRGKAMELMMTAEMIDAEQALRLGLVNYVVESHESLLPKCEEILHKIYEKAPIAISQVIQSVYAAIYQSGEKGYLAEANGFAKCISSKDFKEGTQAFLQKRRPVFTGK